MLYRCLYTSIKALQSFNPKTLCLARKGEVHQKKFVFIDNVCRLIFKVNSTILYLYNEKTITEETKPEKRNMDSPM